MFGIWWHIRALESVYFASFISLIRFLFSEKCTHTHTPFRLYFFSSFDRFPNRRNVFVYFDCVAFRCLIGCYFVCLFVYCYCCCWRCCCCCFIHWQAIWLLLLNAILFNYEKYCWRQWYASVGVSHFLVINLFNFCFCINSHTLVKTFIIFTNGATELQFQWKCKHKSMKLWILFFVCYVRTTKNPYFTIFSQRNMYSWHRVNMHLINKLTIQLFNFVFKIN